MSARVALGGLIAGASALVFAAGLYLLAHQDEDASGAAASLSKAAVVEAQPVALPTAPTAAPEPLSKPDDSDARSDRSAAPAPPPSSAPRKLADIAPAVQLSGRVVDERGAPVAGAEVIHVPSGAAIEAMRIKLIPFGPRLPWAEFVRARSDESGRFVLATHDLPRSADKARPPLPEGTYYATAMQAAPVPSLVVRHPDFAATLFTCLAYVEGDFDVGDIVVPPGAAIVGRVIDESGVPIAGAQVTVDTSDSSMVDDKRYDEWLLLSEVITASSDADGRFALGGDEWPGNVRLVISAPGFVTQETKLFAEVGARNDAGDIVLARGHAIAGVVLDAQGRPLPEARVKARQSGFNPAEGATDTAAWEFSLTVKSNHTVDIEALTDERGAFELLALEAERYAVLAGKDGFEPVKLDDVPVGTRDVVLTLAPSASLIVKVVDARTREPVTGVTATGRRLPGGSATRGIDIWSSLRVLTGDEAVAVVKVADAPRPDTEAPSPVGLLAVLGLGAARNTLTVSADGYATTEFDLPAMEPAGRITQEVALARESSISGMVVDGRGAPIDTASIKVTGSVLSVSGAKPRVETTDAEGLFHIGGLAAGEWKLSASAPGFARPEPQAVTVSSEQALERVRLTLIAGARIAGIVLGPDGKPRPGCAVTARLTSVAPTPPIVEATAQGIRYRNDPEARVLSWTTTTDEVGRFQVPDLEAGSYDVTSEPGAKASVVLAAGGAVDVELRLRQPPLIRGRVTDGDGPVAGAFVECHIRSESDGGWSELAQAETDEAGGYAMELSQAGDCLVSVEDHDSRAPPRRVLASWDTPTVVDLAFGGERLTGRVVDGKTGDPLAGASVSFSDESAQERDGLGPNLRHFYRSSTETGADGRFETHRLQPGRYTVWITKKGYAPALRGPRTVPSKDDELRVELVAGAIVSGVVRAAGGAALEPNLRINVRIDDAVLEDGDRFERKFNVQPDGRFERRDLPAGHGVVQVLRFAQTSGAEEDWTVLSEKPCVLVSGERTVVDLQVAP